MSTRKISKGDVHKSVQFGAETEIVPDSYEYGHEQNVNTSKHCASAIPPNKKEQQVRYSWKKGQLSERDGLILNGVVSARNLGQYAMMQKNTDPQRWAKLDS